MSDGDDDKRGFKVTDRRAVRDEDGAGTAPAATRPGEDGPADLDPREVGARLLPEIDFGTFILSLASSVLQHLGELAPQGADAPQANLSFARQTIDILGMLEEKTRGNLTDDEARLLQHLLFDLRLKFVDARKRG